MGFGAFIFTSGLGLITSCFSIITNFFITTFSIKIASDMAPIYLWSNFDDTLGCYIFRLQFVERYILNINGFNKDALVSNHYKSLKLRSSFIQGSRNIFELCLKEKEITEYISDVLWR